MDTLNAVPKREKMVGMLRKYFSWQQSSLCNPKQKTKENASCCKLDNDTHRFQPYLWETPSDFKTTVPCDVKD
eukprot:m.332665 g.332665  ORF g.332665 m.332665 type:complete len:73 (+) comp16982_c0_seq1:656-874(+)